MKTTILTLAMLWAYTLSAQHSFFVTDYNNVSTYNTNAGILFQNTVTQRPAYEIPKGGSRHTIFNLGMWFGATDNSGNIKLSSSSYHPAKELFPGPISQTNDYTSQTYLDQYAASIWRISSNQIDNHLASYMQPGYVPIAEILNWPANGDPSIGVSSNLAPFVDVDNDGVYNPFNGDYPNVRGDNATYVIMNDASRPHTNTGTDPLGIEVHLMMYEYASNDYLHDQVFMNLKVINRSITDYSDFINSLYIDFDLGGYTDDFIGSSEQNNMVYVYNGDAYDEDGTGILGYGNIPPATGVMCLNQSISSAGYFVNGVTSGSPSADPDNTVEYWNAMNGKWVDGSDWVHGGYGYAGSPGATATLTSFLYSGNPLESSEWSEVTNNNPPGDRRGLLNMAASQLNSGEEVCYDYVVLTAFGNSHLNSVEELYSMAGAIQSFYDNQSFSCDFIVVGTSEDFFSDYSVYPNPYANTVTIDFGRTIDQGEMKVFDISGRLVESIEVINQSSMTVGADYKEGVYTVVLTHPQGKVVSKIIKK